MPVGASAITALAIAALPGRLSAWRRLNRVLGDGDRSAAASVRALAPGSMLSAATSSAEVPACAEGIKP